MNTVDLPSSNEPVGEPLRWYEVWALVIAQPSRDSFRRILADPTAKPLRPFLWVALTGLVMGILDAAVTQLMGVSPFSQYNLQGRISQSLCAVYTAPLFAVAGLAISTGLMRGAAILLRGAGNRNDLVYCLGAVQAPLAIVTGLVSIVGSLLTGGRSAAPLFLLPVLLMISGYAIVLYVLAVDTVEKFGVAKSIITALMPVLALLAFGVFMVLALGRVGGV